MPITSHFKFQLFCIFISPFVVAMNLLHKLLDIAMLIRAAYGLVHFVK